jgi:LAO/AO transport system kinase
MLGLGERRGPGDWRPPVVRAVATTGEGLADVVEALDKHRAWLAAEGRLGRRRARRAAGEVEAIALTELRGRLGDLRGGTLLGDLAAEVVAGRTDPYTAADRLLASL